MSEPKWMTIARSEIGTKEIPGTRHNHKIVQYFADAGHNEVTDDETAWCAAFVGSCLERSGEASTRMLTARSYLKWGVPVDEPRPGDVVVFWRDSPNSWKGHVAFFVEKKGGTIYVLGGNQLNAVNIKAYSASTLLGYRRPKSASKKKVDEKWARALDVVRPSNQSVRLYEYSSHVGERLTPETMPAMRARRDAESQDVITDILWKNYWVPSYCQKLPEEIAVFVFDTAIQFSPSEAVMMLQDAVGTEADGEVGKATLAAIKAFSSYDIITKMYQARMDLLRRMPDWDLLAHKINRHIARIAEELVGPTGVKVADHLPAPKMEFFFMADTTSKYWTQSLTIWGTIVTFLSTVAPALGKLVGWDITITDIQNIGDSVTIIIQAVGGLVGTILAVVGRVKAKGSIKLFG